MYTKLFTKYANKYEDILKYKQILNGLLFSEYSETNKDTKIIASKLLF